MVYHERFLVAEGASPTLVPHDSQSKVMFVDDKTYDLGADPDGSRFQELSERFLAGNYYPPDDRFAGKFGRRAGTFE